MSSSSRRCSRDSSPEGNLLALLKKSRFEHQAALRSSMEVCFCSAWILTCSCFMSRRRWLYTLIYWFATQTKAKNAIRYPRQSA